MTFSDYIGKYADFHIKNDKIDEVYKGQLIQEDDNIGVELVVRSNEVNILKNQKLYITGRILSKNIALINCLSIRYTTSNNMNHIKEETNSYISFIPTEIIYDYPDNVDPLKIYGISGNINQLCWLVDFPLLFEPGHPLEPAFISLFKSSSESDRDTINITGLQKASSNIYHSTIDNIVQVSVYYKNPTTPDTAMQKISSIRNLFSFFTDYYLEISDFNLLYNQDNTQSAKYYINYTEKNELVYKPGLLPSDYIWSHFSEIYDRWNHFSETNKPLVWLYYEILCKHSIGVNSFLNQCQALELYSSRTPMRNTAAKNLYKATVKNPHKKTPLSFRLYDMILQFELQFPADEEHWLVFAKRMANVRNYYTHFSNEKREPTQLEVSAFTKLTRLMLIEVVYTELGIPSNIVHTLLNRIQFSNICDYIGMVFENLQPEDFDKQTDSQ